MFSSLCVCCTHITCDDKQRLMFLVGSTGKNPIAGAPSVRLGCLSRLRMRAVRWRCLSFQGLTVPMRKLRPGFVGALAKIQQHLFRRLCTAHILVAQEKLALVGTVPGCTGTKRRLLQSRRCGNGIGVEGRLFEGIVPWPEPTTDHFVRVGLARN